ncbi:2'-5' RNA ligase family protein [Mycobacterium sp. 236(2023)]|uniref:2'-5' RNA ligase family protein n=1 Tax=Mycobacterium sp. 236(2023) TaxID=3038163 RepID=UPI0024156E42|nr:2'-5' RNA ligase family protein [Mycobacterium sp. 236(2023)]MDG4667779.1 2'-5' RNA ligase family protein [Mycobacterium sp. 236(2023)]
MLVRLVAVVAAVLLLGTAGAPAITALADVEQAKTMGGIVALYPSDADAQALAVPGGAPAAELHITLVDYGPDVRGRPDAELRHQIGDLTARRRGPVAAQAFGHAVFNPHDPHRTPSTVYLIGDSPELVSVRQQLLSISQNLDQSIVVREPWIPHVTAVYGTLEKDLTFTGGVHFDRIGLSWAGTTTFWPL